MVGTFFLFRLFFNAVIFALPELHPQSRIKSLFNVLRSLVFDRDTGKAKGYGFCEYRDTDTALSAVRNLNGYEVRL